MKLFEKESKKRNYFNISRNSIWKTFVQFKLTAAEIYPKNKPSNFKAIDKGAATAQYEILLILGQFIIIFSYD